MLRFQDYVEEQKDSIDVSEEQMTYLLALGLNFACNKIGK